MISIIPVYNIESTIRKCLDSVLASEYHDFKLIVVDDGSTTVRQELFMITKNRL